MSKELKQHNREKKKKPPNIQFRNGQKGVPIVAQLVKNLTSIHEDEGLVSGLVQ